jgi:hypothetical protein
MFIYLHFLSYYKLFKRALVFTKKTSMLVTKDRALLQIDKKGRASLGQGRAQQLYPVKTG